MIGLIGAMSIEIEGIREKMTKRSEKTVSGVKFVCGKLCGYDVVTAVCGIGKVFAAICAEAMILNYDPEFIINTGVAGGISNKLKIGDIAIGESVVQHDMDTTPIGDPKGLLSGINKVYLSCDPEVSKRLSECARELGFNTVFGTIATGDQFIASSEKKDELKNDFSAIAAEMEGGAIGHVCYVNGVRFAVLRAISDSANEESVSDYPTFAKAAADGYIKIIEKFVSKI